MPKHLILVLSGVLKLSVTLVDGRTQIVGLRFPGDIVTTRSLALPWFATVQVVEEARLCLVDAATVSRLREENETFRSLWADFANREIEIAQEHLVTLGRRSPVERLASFLHELANRGRLEPFSRHEISIPISREEIGNYLGLTSETVSRQFTRLRDAGYIKMVSPSRIVVQDWEALGHLNEGRKVFAAV